MPDNRDGGRSTRFKPGRSGNPKGRPRKRKDQDDASAFDVLLDREVPVTMEGASSKLSLEEGLFYRTYQDALAGDSMAIRTVLKAMVEGDALRTPNRARIPTITSLFPDPAGVDDALLALGIASQLPDQTRADGRPCLQLEPRVVNVALARRKRKFLGRRRLTELKANTRNPDEVQWPSEGEE